MTTVAAPSSDSDAPPIPQPVGRARDDTRLALLFLLPALIGFVVFLIWPTLRGIYLSFTEFNLLTPPRFNGLDNYVRMVQDPIFWNAMGVTLYYVAINIGLQTVLALVIAVMMQRLTQKTWLRGIVLTPYLVSNVVAAMVFLWILDYQLGFANQVLAALGLDRIAFFTSDALVIPTGGRLARAAVLHLRRRLRALPVRLRLGDVGGAAADPDDRDLGAVPDDPCRQHGPELMTRAGSTDLN